MSLSRTFPPSGLLVGDLIAFCVTWPTSGMMRSGVCSERLMSVRRTTAPACGWLPTPTATANQTCPSMMKHASCRNLVEMIGPGPIPPRSLRVDDGVSTGLDSRRRLRALGNAVVPLAAQMVGEAVMRHHRA